MLQWLTAVFTVTSVFYIFRDLIVILLDLFSFTDLKEIQFVSMITVFVDDIDHFSFSLMNAFRADVRINEILVRILNIVKQSLLMILWSLLIVVCDVNVTFSLILSLLSLLFLLLLLMLLLWLLMSILLTSSLTVFENVTSLSLITDI